MGFKETYNKGYKLLLIIPIALLLFSLLYLGFFYQKNNDFIRKDISLTGGTTITIYPGSEISLSDLNSFLSSKASSFSIREVTGLTTGKQEAVIVETPIEPDEMVSFLEEYLKYKLTAENSSTEFTGASLSQAFYSQLIKAIIFAFILMAIVVLIIFRTAVPSFAVILSAFADIIMTLAFVDMLGIEISTAGIVAFLMLIGYSVDTDIMLTSYLFKHKEGEVDSRLFSSFKTGLTMTLTSLAAVLTAFFITSGLSEVLKQIFLILTIGLIFDIINTWLTNASLLKWYIEIKNKKQEQIK